MRKKSSKVHSKVQSQDLNSPTKRPAEYSHSFYLEETEEATLAKNDLFFEEENYQRDRKGLSKTINQFYQSDYSEIVDPWQG